MLRTNLSPFFWGVNGKQQHVCPKPNPVQTNRPVWSERDAPRSARVARRDAAALAVQQVDGDRPDAAVGTCDEDGLAPVIATLLVVNMKE